MKLPEAPWQKREGMRRLLKALDVDQGSTRYVGGSVRDQLLGLPVSDIDLATRLEPGAVMKRLQRARIKAVPTGIAHGTITAVLRHGPVEVTTLRRDVSTDGRRATIAYTDDWKQDAARRDFTINALSADPVTLEIHDYFGGAEDLAARRLRFIGDPLTRIAEDHLRILRFFRFHGRFGQGDPDPAALEACAARANDLMALSRERIADELLKLLTLPDPAPTLELMVGRGILRPVLPEIDESGVAELVELVRRERAAGVEPQPLRRLAALLPADPGLAAAIAARLRLSKKAGKRLISAAGRRGGGEQDAEALAYRIGAQEAVDRLLLAGGSPAEVRRIEGWTRPRFPLSGGDLIAMGLSPGPIVAKTLQAVEDDWVRGGFSADRETVRRLARARVDQLLRDSQ
ncbi:MAG TPA: CCA tRNA nucleotidyltransferase [Allosphingosinicella sp.]|nr:CCA tRNA nucleotidyltransferase [Allosphingosinicella sp.]